MKEKWIIKWVLENEREFFVYHDVCFLNRILMEVKEDVLLYKSIQFSHPTTSLITF